MSILTDLNLEINILSREEQDKIGTESMITPGARLDDDHKKENLFLSNEDSFTSLLLAMNSLSDINASKCRQ